MEGLAGKQADAVSPAGAGWNLARRPVKNSDFFSSLQQRAPASKQEDMLLFYY